MNVQLFYETLCQIIGDKNAVKIEITVEKKEGE